MALIMDENDKHEELSDIQFLKGNQRSQSINPQDQAAMQGINHLKDIEDEEDQEIKKIEKYLQEEDEKIQLDFSKFDEDKINEDE